MVRAIGRTRAIRAFYHFHQGKLVKRTLDHSYVQSLINQGELTEQQALDHPHANILMGCLGTENDPPVDLHMVPKLEAGRYLAGLQ